MAVSEYDKAAWMLLSEGIGAKEAKKSFAKKKRDINWAASKAQAVLSDLEKAKKAGADVVTYIDEEYPDCLRNISQPPLYFYAKGDIGLLNYPVKVTMVGSRNATAYGLNAASVFAYELSENRVCVVSGGARGIDTASLRGAMRGRTPVICVIGTGIDVVYPKENARLFEEAAKKGLIITEYPPGTEPLPQNFPKRNRIMTALGDSVVVVEAAQRSGALISASYALNQGKTIFAVPGNIDSPTSRGTNELLRDGALFALSSSDILFELIDRIPSAYRAAENYGKETMEDYNIRIESAERPTSFESAVLNAVAEGKRSYDEILEYCACDARRLTATLTMMQIKGLIRQIRGDKYEPDKEGIAYLRGNPRV